MLIKSRRDNTRRDYIYTFFETFRYRYTYMYIFTNIVLSWVLCNNLRKIKNEHEFFSVVGSIIDWSSSATNFDLAITICAACCVIAGARSVKFVETALWEKDVKGQIPTHPAMQTRVEYILARRIVRTHHSS